MFGLTAMEGAVQAALEKTVVKTAQVIENELDAEIDRLDNLDSDELDRLRCEWGEGIVF